MNWVAPDHVVIGIIRDALFALCKIFGSNQERRKLNSFFFHTLKVNMHVADKAAFNLRTSEPNNSSFTTSFAIFEFSPTVIE